MPSRYYKILLPVLVFAAAAALCVGVGYRTLREQSPDNKLTPTVTATTADTLKTPTAATSSPSSTKALSKQLAATSSPRAAAVAVPAGYIQTTISVSGLSYEVAVPAQNTVEDAMKLAAAQNPALTFTEKSFPSLGEFIESINGKPNANGYYWFLYVNGKSSDTGMSETILKPDDAIQWQYKHQ